MLHKQCKSYDGKCYLIPISFLLAIYLINKSRDPFPFIYRFL